MHDPEVEAFSIRRPWPKVSKLTREYETSFRGAFWRFWGLELYWPAMVTVWHVEPGGADIGTVCGWGTWRKHPRHWKLQFHTWQELRRRAFDRCSWCGGKSRKRDVVNCSYGWDPTSEPDHWWQSKHGVYHGDCLSVDTAHNSCVCSLVDGGPWENTLHDGIPYGNCSTCGGFRRMEAGDHASYIAHIATTGLMKSIPAGERDPEVMKRVRAIWAAHRAETEGRNDDE